MWDFAQIKLRVFAFLAMRDFKNEPLRRHIKLCELMRFIMFCADATRTKK